MQFIPLDPPRRFPVGVREIIYLKDCGRVALEPDEQVTFVTASGAEYDVVRKSWGYYATPSLNARLPNFGLKSALVRSGERLYLLLIEESKLREFYAYLAAQGMEIIEWLDQSVRCKVQGFSPNTQPSVSSAQHLLCSGPISPCRFCTSPHYALIFVYDAPPAGETSFPLVSGEAYHREMWQCQGCGHFVNRHGFDLRRLYEGGYVDATYNGDKLLATFQKIMSLPPERSDNYQRVQRIMRYIRERERDGEKNGAGEEERSVSSFSTSPPTLLDVGAGLCVFPARMREEGWECTALDPDPRAVAHAREHVGVQGRRGDFLTTADLGTYDLITFNKVLEHVEDPISMLRKSRQHLRSGGVVYVELPDGETAAREGAGREEFFLEHFHVFSMTSLSLLAMRAGFSAQCLERVREPSGKFTLCAFFTSL
jgi:SAM-dependent methyltransferase